MPLEPDRPAGRLSVGLKQRLEIVKALATDVRILLLDEPTAVLAPGEAEELLRVVRAFTARGGSAVLITHKLDEALAAADRVTVLRQGVVVHEGAVAGETRESLAAAMIGHGREGSWARAGPFASLRVTRRRATSRQRPRACSCDSKTSKSRGTPATASRCGARRSRSALVRSSASRRSRATDSGSCFARWRAGCTRSAAGVRWRGRWASSPKTAPPRD